MNIVSISSHFLFADALSILALNVHLRQESVTSLPAMTGEGLASWQSALEVVLEGYVPGSSKGARKPHFLTSEEFKGANFGTIDLKRRLLRQLVPEAIAQLPFIFSELETRGALFRSFQEAAAETSRTGAPVWIAASAKFSTPQFIREDWLVPVNESGSILFLSGPHLQGYYDYSDHYFRRSSASSLPPMEMRASLFWIPEVWGGAAFRSDKPACFVRGEPRDFWVFGTLSECSDRFAVKPYAISGK